MTSKTIIIGLIAVIVVVGGVFLLAKNQTQKVVDMKAVAEGESELAAFGADLVSSDGDEAVLSELDQTLSDVAETTGAISAAASADTASISQEESQIDFSQDLAGFASDDVVLQELDQAFGEVIQ